MSTAATAAPYDMAAAAELQRARTTVHTISAGIAAIAATMTDAGADEAAADEAATNAVLHVLLTERPGVHTAYVNGLRLLDAAGEID